MSKKLYLNNQPETPNLSPNLINSVREACIEAKRFEDAGDYEQACAALESVWRGIGERPAIAGLDDYTAALVLLRVGTLTGWLGSTFELPQAQERAKDLISESIALFERQGCALEAIEAQYELALCYWREGAFDEARILLRISLQRIENIENAESKNLRARLLLRAAIVEFKEGRYAETLRLLETAAPLFDTLSDSLLKGKFHGELATTLKNLAIRRDKKEPYIERALTEYAAASAYFEQAGHLRYCARVENNLAMLYLQLARFTEAHAHLDRAERMLRGIKDIGTLSIIRETRARVLLAEGKFKEAIMSARQASQSFMRGGKQAWAAEAFTTEGMALARLGEIHLAETIFSRAIETAEGVGDLEGAGRAILALIEEVTDYLPTGRLYELYTRADELLARTANLELIDKLRKCGRITMQRMRSEIENSATILDFQTDLENAGTDVQMNPISFPDTVRHFEAQLIERAMRTSENRVTQAAKLLGISHQHLSILLRTRHKQLFYLTKQASNPFKPRRRRHQRLALKS